MRHLCWFLVTKFLSLLKHGVFKSLLHFRQHGLIFTFCSLLRPAKSWKHLGTLVTQQLPQADFGMVLFCFLLFIEETPKELYVLSVQPHTQLNTN